MTPHDRHIIQTLVAQVNALAALPEQQLKKDLWIKSNSLRNRPSSVRPPVLVCVDLFENKFENGALAPRLECENSDLHPMEKTLRFTLFRHGFIHDDLPVKPAAWPVNQWITGFRNWGLQPKTHGAIPYSGGSFAIDPVINKPSDLNQLKIADLQYDREKTLREIEKARDVSGDLLPIELQGLRATVQLMASWTRLRGFEQTMLDLAADAEFLHAGMSIIAQGYRRWYTQAEKLNVLSPPVFDMYQAEDLQREGFDPTHIRLRNLMAFVEAQELTAVSPAMHKTFCLDYEKPLAEMFGLTSYGCCEDLTHKIEEVAEISNLRQIGVTPFADLKKCAERIGNRYVISWRPNPNMLTDPFSENTIRNVLREGLKILRANGCIFHVLLKDIHSCSGHPERLTRWAEILNQEITTLWGESGR